jgi:proton-coupled amino acid transporter
MKNPKNISYVIYSAMTCIVSLYASFSIIGYLVYGNNLQSSVTLNLCARDPITAFFFVLAKLLYGVAIFTSFLLQFYVPMDFIEPPLYAKLKLDYLTYKFPKFHGVIQTTIKLGFRTILVLFTGNISLIDVCVC